MPGFRPAARAVGLLIICLGLATACRSTGRAPAAQREPVGPPAIQYDLVARHAAQLDDKLPARRAGSQQEFAAATYILGHLQRAGYSVRLDAVPVADLVRSTNVDALPPEGDPAEMVVTVAYDTPVSDPRQGQASPEGSPASPEEPPGGEAGSREASREANGEAIGLFLELARAVHAAGPPAPVGFVALGAEHIAGAAGPRGSASLADALSTRQERPDVIRILSTGAPRFVAYGALGPELNELVYGNDIPSLPRLSLPNDPITAARLPHTLVDGPARDVGRVLFRYLTRGAQASPARAAPTEGRV